MVPGHHHDKLKHVEIINFSSAKGLVELTCYILESTTSLECLTLDTTHGLRRCSDGFHKCVMMRKEALVEANWARLVAQTYINMKVPSTTELKILEPCSQCHAVEL
uniref:At1g61320/AtMIF1 LRR domain-containing protein n=1 Tax=Arundo donax TaxID=35708 RepID=A0A0A8Y4J5_ARUDO